RAGAGQRTTCRAAPVSEAAIRGDREWRRDRAPAGVGAGGARGGDRSRSRPARAGRVRGGRALLRGRLRPAQRRHRTRPAEAGRSVHAGQGLRHVLPDRADGTRRRCRLAHTRDLLPRERRAAPVRPCERHGVRDSGAHCLHLAHHDARAGRRDCDGDTGRRRPAARGRRGRSRAAGHDDRAQSGGARTQGHRGRAGAGASVRSRSMTRIRLAGRFDNFPPYPLADVPQIKRELIARGVDVIDLGAGDADLAPPPAAVEALVAATRDVAMNRYPFQLGLPAYRESVAAWMAQRFGVELDPYRELLPLIGSKEGIAHLAFAYVSPGDSTILPDPGYQPYVGGTLLAGGRPHAVPLRPENDFLIPLEELPADVVRTARILYLNYPNNPTAAIAPRAYLESAVE